MDRNGRRSESLLVAAAFIIAAIALTLPLALDLKRTLPSDHGDTLLIAWIIGWDADRLRHGLRGLWDAPIFFPYRGTLAFSETMLGVAVFVGAGLLDHRRSGARPTTSPSCSSFAIAGAGMYLLARELTGSRAAAFAAGMYYAFGPFRMSQYAHLQMVATGWIPIALFGLHRYFSTRRPRWLALFAVAWILQTLSNMYIGYFIAVPIAVVIADGAVARASASGARVAAPARRGRAPRRRGAGAGRRRPTIARAADYHQVRDMSEVVGQQRRPALVHGRQEQRRRVALAADGGRCRSGERTVARPLRGRPGGARILDRGHRSAARDAGHIVYGVVALAAARALARTSACGSGGRSSPRTDRTRWLLAIVPGMDGMRVPARFAIVVVAALSVLLAFGVDWLLRRAPPRVQPLLADGVRGDGRRRRLGRADHHGRLQRARPCRRSRRRVLAGGSRRRAPSAPADPAHAGEQLLDYQFMTLVHGHPIVNGFSGYVTPLVDVAGIGRRRRSTTSSGFRRRSACFARSASAT